MRKQCFHIVWMPEDGGQVRNFRITARTLRAVVGGLVLVIVALGASLAFHVRTFREAQLSASLRAENVALQDQLDGFRKVVDRLEQGIEDAAHREREARLLAGLDPMDEQTRRLGVGGSVLQIEPPAAVGAARARGASNAEQTARGPPAPSRIPEAELRGSPGRPGIPPREARRHSHHLSHPHGVHALQRIRCAQRSLHGPLGLAQWIRSPGGPRCARAGPGRWKGLLRRL